MDKRKEHRWMICGLSDGLVKASHLVTYQEMIRGEQLEKAYPEAERKARMLELEQEIQQQTQIIETLEQVNPSLARKKEKENQVLSQELESIRETLHLPTRDELTFMLYSAARYKLINLKEQCEFKLDYLKGVLE